MVLRKFVAVNSIGYMGGGEVVYTTTRVGCYKYEEAEGKGCADRASYS